MQVPWATLGRQQVQVEIDRLYLLAVPNYMQDAPPPQSTEEEEERLALRKREEVEAEEKRWVQGMQAAEHAQAVAANPGYLQGIINVVLGNLKLKVSLISPCSSTWLRNSCIMLCLLRLCRSQTCTFATRTGSHRRGTPLQ
jgi:hypothetical protein